MNELISVIVPVYNVEEYLRNCLDSILQQSYSELQIILIDDGSTDNSGKICDEYEKKDSRIEVIHQQNSGIGRTRNVGLDRAKGQYIAFVDSDDFIHKDMYRDLIKLAKRNKADLTVCKFQRFKNPNFSVKWEDCPTERILRPYDVLAKLPGDQDEVESVLWNKLYKSSLFNSIRFPEGLINEDADIIYLVIDASNIVIVTDQVYYYYRFNENSITRLDTYLYNMDIFKIYDRQQRYYQEKGYSELSRSTRRTYLDKVISKYKLIKAQSGKKKILKQLKERYNAKYMEGNSPIKGAGYRLFYVSPNLYYVCRNIKLKIKN